ncbi:MAG: hypothetical protein ACYS29_15165, partial [Planctomycetota bacterium]
MLTRKIAIGMVVTALVSICISTAKADYTYVVTVGQGPGYDCSTISCAIEDMNAYGPNETDRGCIEVYDGTYYHNAGIWHGATDEWLPSYCDLKGMGTDIEDVEIKHPSSGTGGNHYVLIGSGNNTISHLKVFTHYGARNGVYLFDDCTISDCNVDTYHGIVCGEDDMVVTRCELSGMGVTAWGTFTISDSNIYPYQTRGWLESTEGIRAHASGTVENVNIYADIESSYQHDDAILGGVYLTLGQNEEVTISNVNVDLTLTSTYDVGETGTLRLCGILSGSSFGNPSTWYPG